MGSLNADCIERIDLRENKWNIIIDVNTTDIKLKDLCGPNFAPNEWIKNSLICV